MKDVKIIISIKKANYKIDFSGITTGALQTTCKK